VCSASIRNRLVVPAVRPGVVLAATDLLPCAALAAHAVVCVHKAVRYMPAVFSPAAAAGAVGASIALTLSLHVRWCGGVGVGGVDADRDNMQHAALGLVLVHTFLYHTLARLPLHAHLFVVVCSAQREFEAAYGNCLGSNRPSLAPDQIGCERNQTARPTCDRTRSRRSGKEITKPSQ